MKISIGVKKYLLSFFVIFASIIYVFSQRMTGRPNASFTALSSIPKTSFNSSATTAAANYKDGQYAGSVADAYYGNIQVKTIINNGKIVDVQFLDYPQDRRTSVGINTDAMPILKSEAIASQSANVEIVSGATDTSYAFQESLASALNQATN